MQVATDSSLSVAHQDYNNAIFQWFTVYRNIGMPLEVSKEYNKETAIEKAKQFCKEFEIEFKSDNPLELKIGRAHV